MNKVKVTVGQRVFEGESDAVDLFTLLNSTLLARSASLELPFPGKSQDFVFPSISAQSLRIECIANGRYEVSLPKDVAS
jgi:hypothetical protein